MNREVTELGSYPYRAIAHLYVTFPDGSAALGTGALVGRNDLLTATHVIYDPDAGGWASSLALAFGVDYNSRDDIYETPSLADLGPFQCRIDSFPGQVFTDGDNRTLTGAESQYDVALIGLDKPIGDQLGHFGLAAGFDTPVTAYQVGYPAGSTGMMAAAVSVERSASFGIYLARASEANELMGPGSSGGPLFVWQDDDPLVIGVRSSGSSSAAFWADVGYTYQSLLDSMMRNDELLGAAVNGTPGPDVIRATFGPDLIDGGKALDRLVYAMSRADYSVEMQGGHARITRLADSHDADNISNVERIVFSDGVLALDVGAGETVGSAYRLYQAAFDREPDLDGLGFWVQRLDGGMSLDEVASRFVGSPEFGRLYGADPGSGALIDGYYQNVLDRAPEAAGYSYWIVRMDQGLEAAQMLALFS